MDSDLSFLCIQSLHSNVDLGFCSFVHVIHQLQFTKTWKLYIKLFHNLVITFNILKSTKISDLAFRSALGQIQCCHYNWHIHRVQPHNIIIPRLDNTTCNSYNIFTQEFYGYSTWIPNASSADGMELLLRNFVLQIIQNSFGSSIQNGSPDAAKWMVFKKKKK